MTQGETITKIQEGQKAPDFALKDELGKIHKLSDYKGKKVVLYFYPKDDTPGCTVQACDFRDHLKEFEKKNAVVLGVSPDDEHSHKKFIEKYKIPYALLCDIDHKVASIYGVWEEKQFMGKVSMGLMRSTFIIDENGLVSKAFFKVSPDAHYEMLLKQL
ncbi:MAG TPA: thioredoxin-dependent thiol peroxidase [Candidatus Nanoarchaeia archaeon]|nr:thioredoxin-dependent thiol peroxidase [Candidatus Nanoarchaeia archaeon]